MSVINVTSYGAVGNGVTDDTTAIQAAAAALVSGDRLYFPGTGIYLVDYFILPASNVTIEGDSGARAEIRKRIVNSTNTPMISCVDKSNITARNLILNGQGPLQSWWDGNPYTADFVVFANNLQIKGGSGHSVSDIDTKNAGSAGVRFYGCTDSSITRVNGDSNGFGSIAIYAYTYSGTPRSSNILITDCRANLDYCDCIRMVQSDDLVVDGCYGTNARFIPFAPAQFGGLYVESVNRATIKNCVAFGNSSRGIDSAPDVNDCIILNNVVYNHPADGILLGASGFLVQKNRCYNNGGRGISAKGSNHFLKDNNCAGHDEGIGQAQSVTGITLVNNDCRGNTVPVSAALRASTGFSELGTIDDADRFAGICSDNGAALGATL